MRCLLLWLLVFTFVAEAHEVRPAYLRVQDISESMGADHYDVLWRVPSGAEVKLTIFVKLPEQCVTRGEPYAWTEAGINIARWTSYCPGGLQGQTITIGDLTASVTDVLARFERTNDTTQVVRLTPTNPAFVVTASESWSEVATTYAWLGIEHILLGIDHLLFVLALLLIISGWKKLVATITSFTVAHSLTLVAATLGWVNVPQKPVEAVIALSILFVATEIVHWRQGRPGITRQRPWIVAFAFGLLHGLGFAGALSEIGLPDHAIPVALLFFNIGVELGQLFFIGCMFVLWAILRRLQIPAWGWRIPVYLIGSLAAFWTMDRIAGFL